MSDGTTTRRRCLDVVFASHDSSIDGGAQRSLYSVAVALKDTGRVNPLVTVLMGVVLLGERLTRQAIFFNRELPADSPEGRLIADEVVSPDGMEPAVERSAAELTSAGMTSLLANRRALRVGQEPLDSFRRYMAGYARDQAYCLYSPALIDNLERNWDAKRRALRPST